MNLRVYVCVCENMYVSVYMCENMYASVCRCACVHVCPQRPEAWDVLTTDGTADHQLPDG